MLSSRYLVPRLNLWKNFLLVEPTRTQSLSYIRRYTGLPTNTRLGCCCWSSKILKTSSVSKFPTIFYSNKLSDGDVTRIEKKQYDTDLKIISQLFPLAKQTLNEIASKRPEKTFDVYHKQIVNLPKGNRKKIPNGEWVCTYSFVWPKKIKFTSTAISKRVASDHAATQALQWLYLNKHINSDGHPLYDPEVLRNLRSTLNEPLRISISENSLKRIENVWNDYENEIKPIYEAVSKEAAEKEIQEQPLYKDSSIDEEDEFSDTDDISEEASDISETSRVHPVYGRNIRPPSAQTIQRRQRTLEHTFGRYREGLSPLPIDDYADKITSALETSRVVILVGAAGCGKSTRVPAAILERCGANTAAVVAEPRRVAAIGLAQRVAGELGEEVGESVGYQVRLQSRPPKPPCGSILYCTSGVLLRRLRSNPGLEGCTHVVVDEAHERDVNTDVLILLLRRALDSNPQLRIVIMSATLDVDVFTRYFDSCPVIEVPGKTYPVEVSYLEDLRNKYGLKLSASLENCKRDRPTVSCTEVVEVIKAVDKRESEGAILVFLPGWSEIKYTKQLLDECYSGSSLHMVVPVHSRLSTQDQIKMFAKPPPGIRKIVLATTIAETSITIPDVVHVIDTGVYKEHRTKEGTGTASLEKTWVSQASAKQRAGRAGRVQPGHCYRLYTKEKESELIPHNTPEILRVPLEQTVLDCKTYAPHDKVQDFLAQLPEPPSKTAIDVAVNDLIDLGALTPSSSITRFGSLLSSFPLHPRLAASLLTAAVIGNVLAAANAIAHCANDVQINSDAQEFSDFRDLKHKYSETCDYSALYWIQNDFEDATDKDAWCEQRHLRRDRLKFVQSLTSLYLSQLLKSGFLESNPDFEELTRFSGADELTSAVLLAGSNSLLTTRRHVKTKGKLGTVTEVFTSKGDRAHIGTESVNYAISKRAANTTLLAYHCGRHSNERRALVVYNSSVVSPQAALLFCKGELHCEFLEEDNGESSVLTLPRHNLRVYVPTSQADHILKAKEMLTTTFQYYIDRDLSTIEYDLYSKVSRFKIRLVKAVGRIFEESDEKQIVDSEN